MKMVIVPRYEDIFNEPVISLEELLYDISSDLIIGMLSIMQAKIHLGGNEVVTQLEILKLFINRQPWDIQQKFTGKFMTMLRDKGPDDFVFFSMQCILDFLHYVLQHYVEMPMGEDTSPEQELRLFKAYMAFAEYRHQRDVQIFDENRHHSDDFFYKNTWPIMSGQYEAGHLVNPFTEMIRGVVLFNFLEYTSPYHTQISKFLESRGHKRSWNYIFSLLNIIQQSWENSKKSSRRISSFSISVTHEFEPMFDSFTIDVETYRSAYPLEHRNYSGLKDKPLFRYNQDTYLILNWNFFNNKLYEGLLFDIYTYSEIPAAAGFKSFSEFKQYISEAVTEGLLFKKLLKAVLQKKYSTLLFDERMHRGFPDAYYRYGNEVVLFEIKDAFFPAKAIDTTSFQEIKDAIDEKYNQNNKGTGQLVKQIKFLTDNSFEAQPGYKHHRNLIIYPVMVYTDHFFSMPGINNYLQEEFLRRMIEAGLQLNFKKLQPLVFINIRFFIDHLPLLRRPGKSLTDLFNLYYQEQLRAKKKIKRSDELNAFFDCYQNFESSVIDKYEARYQGKEFIKTIVDTLELTQGLHDSADE